MAETYTLELQEAYEACQARLACARDYQKGVAAEECERLYEDLTPPPS